MNDQRAASPVTAGTRRPSVSVVCPFFNEEAIIEGATRRTLGNLVQDFGDDFELILVDDGSRDRSLARLTDLLKSDTRSKHVRVLTYAVNQGRGRALKTGIDDARADIIVTTEVDCSWGDHIARQMFDVLAAHQEIDFVIASPHRKEGGLVNVPFKRVFLTRIGNLLIRLLFESSVTMNTGMTRAYRAAAIKDLMTEENGKEFHLEVLLKLLGLGFRASEVPATLTWESHRFERAQSAPRVSSTRLLRTIRSHLRFIAIAQPVRHYAILTFTSLVISLGFICAAFAMLYFQTLPASNFAIVGLVMFVISLLFGGFSILFFQIREIMRATWMQSYSTHKPPSARRARLAFPESS